MEKYLLDLSSGPSKRRQKQFVEAKRKHVSISIKHLLK